MKYYVTERLSDKISETPEGFLLCLEVPITRTGTLEYDASEVPIAPNNNGLVIISRTEADVFDPKTLASFEGKPVTINHPDDFVTPENWKVLSVGAMQNIRRGDGENKDKILADLLISDKDAISLVKNGLREVSCGYEADYMETGEGEGRQIDIRGNHLALVRNGRAGPSCAIHDNKRGVMSKKIKDNLKKLLNKALDESLPDEATVDKPACDESTMAAIDAGIKKAMDAYMESMKPKDGESPIEDRLKAVEDKVASMSEEEAESADADENGEEGEESEEEEEEGEEGEDDGEDDGELVGDTAARAEILVPGFNKTKDVKAEALKEFYKTADGKKILNMLSGNKPTFDSAKSPERVESLFVAAAELMKAQRSGNLAKTKAFSKDAIGKSYTQDNSGKEVTVAELNDKHAKYWADRNKA